ncbi:MAG TPA: hypothetical protein VFN90_10155 [Gemmatimonadales bacterium]|nr:hypothetical protein [Gemmatimonadales bacterium]
MVPARDAALSRPGRRAAVAFVLAAAWVWWQARATGTFTVVGLEPPLADDLGPLLPSLSAGLSAAATLMLVDGLLGPLAGVVAAMVLTAMPGFLPLHVASLQGPPLLATTLLMLAMMVHGPRFSIAYGAIAAIGAVFIAPEGIGLPIAAVLWAAMRHPGGNGQRRRALLALAPLLVALVVARGTGDAWPDGQTLGWYGGLDRALRAAGTIVGDQLAPGIEAPAVRWFAIADLTLILLALGAVAWRRVAVPLPEGAPLRRWYGAAAMLGAGLVLGLGARRLFVTGTPDPDLAAVFPLAVLGALVSVVSFGALWPRWPRWGKAIALVLSLGWLQAAIRG